MDWEAQDDLSRAEAMPWRFLPLGVLPSVKAGAWQDAMRTTEDFEVGMGCRIAIFFLSFEIELTGNFIGKPGMSHLFILILLCASMFNREQP